ncbi:MAG: RtcB family protein [Propylenella sp.]
MSNVKIYGEHDAKTIGQMERCMTVGSAVAGVLCADGHLGYAHPIGGVVAYEEHISISGVGFDIACGNMAVRLDAPYAELSPLTETIVDDIARSVSFGLGRSNAEPVDHALFESDLWKAAGVPELKSMAQNQLGTCGSGNHYVDLFEDEEGFVWIGVHFGSRGLGHKITTKHLKLVGAKDGMEVDPAVVHQDTDIGRSYIAGVQLGGLYAYAGREWVVEKVKEIIGAAVTDTVHNHHNFAWRERHGEHEYWVVRKGATPAFPGQRGFVGGSMGDNAVILSGVESEVSAASLYSTVHGAGRIMSRTEARGRFVKDPETGKKIRQQGRVRHDEMHAWIRERGVSLRGADLDEAPQAYRRLPDVLAAHAGTIKIEHTLRPFGVIMAGADVFDPFKD